MVFAGLGAGAFCCLSCSCFCHVLRLKLGLLELLRSSPVVPLRWKVEFDCVDLECDKIVEVEVVYHSKPAYLNPLKLSSKKWVAKCQNQQPKSPRIPTLGPKCQSGVVIHPSDQMQGAEALVDTCDAHEKSSENGLELCSIPADSDSKLVEAAEGSNCFPPELEGSMDQSTPDFCVRAALQCPEAGSHLDPAAGIYVLPNAEAETVTLDGSIASDAGVSHVAVALLEDPRDAGSPPRPLERPDGLCNFSGRSGHARISGVANFRSAALGRSGLTRVVAGAENFRRAAFNFRFPECLCKWVPERLSHEAGVACVWSDFARAS
ncbi:hypothetical protein Nepgr_027229 [Nepenthes gracilis]|uniref:Uncharacterized protein n=1 Tax=Nepenthes gracilis TaxID=150966 RepID=A0AAD3TB05_NEPGR|nr:hypothetical protein Nepgr_027229 [Nepenthes gracilis]